MGTTRNHIVCPNRTVNIHKGIVLYYYSISFTASLDISIVPAEYKYCPPHVSVRGPANIRELAEGIVDYYVSVSSLIIWIMGITLYEIACPHIVDLIIPKHMISTNSIDSMIICCVV